MMWTLLETIYDRSGVSKPLHRTWQPIIRTKGLPQLGCLVEPDIGAELRIAFQTSSPQLIQNSVYRNCTSDARELPANAAFAQHVRPVPPATSVTHGPVDITSGGGTP